MSRADLLASLDFRLDPFQERAMRALDEGRSVLVAAPTGSGKTVVAEYAVAKALEEGGKAFYTTPLKALSNQKYGDLVRRYGRTRVGLLTGDNSLNGDAPVVVMTTEVLRNMIYSGSAALRGLRYVVLDEVHYLQDPYRGPVWEEVIVHTPQEVDLVCLSATVSNAEEVADWIATVRGATDAVIEEARPVELHNLYMVGDLHAERPLLLPTFVNGRPNPEAEALDRQSAREARPFRGRRRGRFFTPRRTEVVEVLGEHEMLPVIYFVFSRAGCDESVRYCLREGVRLTTPEERTRIRGIAEEHVGGLSDDDLRLLGYDEWVTGLEAGVAAHHAGMVPPFKETVEACFGAALVKVVFATETLALGINMPARSVVIEKLTKFSGESHQPLTPGEYTQLTGRAGRRGIDEVGYGVVLWSPFVPFDQVAGLASRRSYALTSAFRPTYNMAANLVQRYAADEAHHLLNLSFAQYQADSDVVRLEAELERRRAEIERLKERAACELGDVEEYRRLWQEAERAGRARPSDRAEIQRALEAVRLGDVLVTTGVGARVAVVSTSRRKGGEVRLGAVTLAGKRVQLVTRDFPAPPRAVARVDLPTPYAPSDPRFVAQVTDALRRVRPAQADGDGERGPRGGRTAAMRRNLELASHPVSDCPDLARHLRAARRADDLARDLRSLERRIRGRTESLARQFDRVLRVLEAWEYVEGWELTDAGERLARLYHECDLLVVEALRSGLFDGLDPPSVAALASTLTYEARGPSSTPATWYPKGPLRERWDGLQRVARALNLSEEEALLPPTRAPDPGFAPLAQRWAAGSDLDDVIGEEELSGGDFVRIVKQLIDLLRQMGEAAVDPDTAGACRDSAGALFRGVVAASSTVATTR